MSFSFVTSWVFLLAEGDAGKAVPGGGNLLSSPLLPMMAIFLLAMWFLMIQPQRKEQSRRKSMLAALKKNDRIMTTGGIYGVVVSVQRDTDEVAVRVDETTNAKLRMSLSAIARVMGDESSQNTESK